MLYLAVAVWDTEDAVHWLADELLRCRLEFNEKGAHTFELTIWDPDKTVSGWLTEGCKTAFYVDKQLIADPSITDPKLITLKQLVGIVQSVEVLKQKYASRKLTVEGIDQFSNTTLQRVVVESYQNMEVSLIVKDLLEKYASDYDRTTYVNATSTTLEDVRFNYRTLKDCLDMLAEASNFTYYCDADLKVHWVQIGSESTGITYTSNDVAPVPKKAKTIVPTKCRVHIIGGNRYLLDQYSEGASAYVSLKDHWYAQSFTPDWDYLSQISLKLAKVGSPAVVNGLICKDYFGPSEVVARFVYEPSFLTTEAAWKPSRVSKELVRGEKYWIVLPKLGDATDTVRWYHDNGSSGEHAYSDNGTSWTVSTGTFVLSHRTYYQVTVIAQAADSASKELYHGWREIVIRDESIIDYDVAKTIAQAKLNELKPPQTVLSTINVLDPVELPQPTKTLTLNLSDFDINESFVLREVVLDFQGGQKRLHKMRLALGKRAEELGKVLAATKIYLDKVALGKFGTEAEFLTLIKYQSSTLTLTDVLSANVKNAWRIGISTFGGDDRLG
jgi:hypothetical protein